MSCCPRRASPAAHWADPFKRLRVLFARGDVPAVDTCDPTTALETVRVEVVHAARVPAHAAACEQGARSDLPFRVRRWCQLGDLEPPYGRPVRARAELTLRVNASAEIAGPPIGDWENPDRREVDALVGAVEVAPLRGRCPL